MINLIEVPAPSATRAVSPDVRAWVDPTARVSVLLSRDDGELHLSVSSPDRRVTDDECEAVRCDLLPATVLTEDAGYDGKTRHFWESRHVA
jgi:hypothetical protein